MLLAGPLTSSSIRPPCRGSWRGSEASLSPDWGQGAGLPLPLSRPRQKPPGLRARAVVATIGTRDRLVIARTWARPDPAALDRHPTDLQDSLSAPHLIHQVSCDWRPSEPDWGGAPGSVGVAQAGGWEWVGRELWHPERPVQTENYRPEYEASNAESRRRGTGRRRSLPPTIGEAYWPTETLPNTPWSSFEPPPETPAVK